MNNKNLKPFKLFALKNFPFIEADFDAITNYELLCKIVEYLNNVIASQNQVTEQVQTLTNNFNDLLDYVNNYFDNLDVQEEIDNKLDDMVEQGTLQEIIADYLNSKAVFGFDNVASMKTSTNLIDGSYARTLGYYAKNDNGGATYKIREITNEDVVDEQLIIALNDVNLIAELIIEEKVNIKTLGIHGDGETDDKVLIQNAIDKLPNKTIYFPSGTYIISAHIDTSADNDKNVCLELDDYAIIKASANYSDTEAMISLGSKNYDNYYLYRDNASYGIKGGIIDCNNKGSGISIANAMRTFIQHVTIRNVKTKGIDIKYGRNNGSSDAYIDDIVIVGGNNSEAYGLSISGYDNHISNVRTFSCKYAINIEGGGNHFENIHCLAMTSDLNENYNSMRAFSISSNNNVFDYIYSDQFPTGLYVGGKYKTYVNNYVYYIWDTTQTEGQHLAIRCTNGMHVFVDNMMCHYQNNGATYNRVLRCDNPTGQIGYIKNVIIDDTTLLNDSADLYYNPKFNLDVLKLPESKISNKITGLTIDKNLVSAENHNVNWNFTCSGFDVTANQDTRLCSLPPGYYDSNNTVNLEAKLQNYSTFVGIVCWITTSGDLYINSKENISGSQLRIFGSLINI